MPQNLETIPEETFESCSSLKNIDIPQTVKEIGAGAFTKCIYNHRTTKTNQKYPSVNL